MFIHNVYRKEIQCGNKDNRIIHVYTRESIRRHYYGSSVNGVKEEWEEVVVVE